MRDPYSACCAAELVKEDRFDFLLFSLADNDNYSHRHGPEATVESIASADRCFSSVVEAAGGLDDFLDRYALILVADHAQTDVERGLPLAELLGREWSVLAPSERPARAGPARGQPDRSCRPCLPAPRRGTSAPRPARCAGRLAVTEGVDLVCWLEGPGVAVVERAGEQLRFRPGTASRDRAGELGARGRPGGRSAARRGRRLRSEEYPDPLAAVLRR
jgi:hypothetical protein